MNKPFSLEKWSFLFKTRYFLGFILLILILIFFYLKIVPGGQITYSRDYEQKFKSGKGFIYGFNPAERVDLISGHLPRLIADPVYFDLFTPRTFDRARVTIEYYDHLSEATPIIEAGVLFDKLTGAYQLQPLDNKILDKLFLEKSGWSSLKSEAPNSLEPELILLQANKTYTSLADFKTDLAAGKLKNCPAGPKSCIALYNYQLAPNYLLLENSASGTWPALKINRALRGAQQFYIYVAEGKLRLDFIFVDLNQDKAQDPMTINIYAANQIVAARSIEDNNPDQTSGQEEIKELSLMASNLVNGVYKVELKISDDIVIKEIKSSSVHLAFINKIWPVSSSGTVTWYTDANYLQVQTINPASLQKIIFAGKSYNLDDTFKQFNFYSSSSEAIKSIQIKPDDLILENNGVFAVSADSLFNPDYKKVDKHFALSDSITYIMAAYRAPLTKIASKPKTKVEQELKIASATFDLKSAYREKGKYRLMIAMPGLQADNKDNYLEIKKITIDLSGRTLWQKLFN